MRWLGVLAAAAACGDNLAPAARPALQGGERLDLWWLQSGEARELASERRLFDRARDEPCELVDWDDGTRRCVPLRSDPEAVAVYADADCRELRGVGVGGETYYLYGEWLAERFVASAVFRRGGASAEQGAYYERRDGRCVGPIPTAGRVMVELADGVAGTELVGFTTEIAATASRVTRHQWLGDDGTVIAGRFYDRQLEIACSPSFGEGDLRCEPDGATVGGTFLDAACTQPAVADLDARFAHRVDDDSGCTTSYELSPARRVQVYERDGDRCVATAIGDYRAARAIESPVIEVTTVEGPGRMLERRAVGAPIGVFDRELGVECSAYADFVRTRRCLPSVAGARAAFVDPSCTRAVTVAARPTGRCDPATPYAHVELSPATYARIGDPAGALYIQLDTGCVPLVPPDRTRYHLLGDRVGVEVFSPVTIVHQP